MDEGTNVINVVTDQYAKGLYYFSVISSDGQLSEKRQVLIK